MKFHYLRRNLGEPVAEIIKRSNNIYNKIPLDCKPLVAVAKIIFSKSFHDYFVVMLRERKYENLVDVQTNEIEVEPNILASTKLKAKVEKVERRMKSKEESSSSSRNKEEDHNINEIT